ncbi:MULTISPECIES: PfkB family carbohydrate kinase [unclassified Paenibacillus]|uniref:PfkB family carbohydrate kinase n=1 Tax=unclassified Paenibacillus TaxID=185978 RepID=UPI0027818EEE|nr:MULTISPECIES: PfkB family carbohydrate kinase [unclassified Paenibacillus]MDQ0902079.1 fructokinase [Paenibacillus sp. V4I7]MDQ0919427.1 fructokinase [Paenibacillus sp. V4I5]
MGKTYIVCLGELLIDFVPEVNGQALADVTSFQRAAGGAPANVAAAVAKLGGDARFIGKIGRDPFGDFLVRTLDEVGVHTAVVQTDEAKTGLAFVSLRADGERDFLFFRDPAADMLLRADEVQAQWLEDAAVYHFGSVSLIAEPCRTATLDAARRAREFGALVSYDPNVRLALWPSADAARAEILAQLPLADVVKVSEEEVEFLLGVDATTGAQQLLQRGPKVIIITLGPGGCRVVTARQDVVIPGTPVAAVDTTGAGDSFVGGMLYQLVSLGATPATIVDVLAETGAVEQVFAFANRVGAITTTRRGAIPALPTLDEVQ